MVFVVTTDYATKKRMALEIGGTAAIFEREDTTDYVPNIEVNGKYVTTDSFDNFLSKMSAVGITVAM